MFECIYVKMILKTNLKLNSIVKVNLHIAASNRINSINKINFSLNHPNAVVCVWFCGDKY